jgi:hypothetical protein
MTMLETLLAVACGAWVVHVLVQDIVMPVREVLDDWKHAADWELTRAEVVALRLVVQHPALDGSTTAREKWKVLRGAYVDALRVELQMSGRALRAWERRTEQDRMSRVDEQVERALGGGAGDSICPPFAWRTPRSVERALGGGAGDSPCA